MKNKFAGKFIVLDGPDGCGKTTQSELLTKWLENSGVKTASFRDPGGTAVGEQIRQILLNPEHAAMSERAELLLYMAARAQLWKEKISPALEMGKCVVLDRWLSSTCAYQGYAGGLGIENVIKLATDCLERVWPDLTIVLDIDLDVSARRLSSTPDRMEQKGKTYHAKVRDGFLKLARGRENFTIVNVSGSIEAVGEKVIETVNKKF
ncbi:MAG: dTMP kinase [Planctomycetes bacterium]|nr:dTMP kinase [Planctomycetota bacterium]MCK5473006.1 dTMP kinase [Planctomycetota bacterium]